VLLLLVVSLAPLGVSACGGGGSKSQPAGGKVYQQASVERCLKRERLLLADRRTSTGIDFTAYWRNGRNRADFGVESSPDAAASRQGSWTHLAEQANVKNASIYYHRYGNVVVAWQRLPGPPDRALVERCLA